MDVAKRYSMLVVDKKESEFVSNTIELPLESTFRILF